MADAVTHEWLDQTWEQVKNWGRWGEDDERGALNLITPERRSAAGALIDSGQTVSCAFDLSADSSPGNPNPVLHHMLMAGDSADHDPMPGFQQTSDWLGIACHGIAVSHLDALCHVFVRGQMYNGFPGSAVKTTVGGEHNSVMAGAGGICGRGVLLDIPRQRGVDWIDPTEPIMPAELDRAEADAGMEVGPGDICIIATGRARRRHAEGPQPMSDGIAGLHATAIPWIRERDVAVLGSDGVSDNFGPGVPMLDGWSLPLHQHCLAGMGVHLLDNLDLVELAGACADHNRWEFFLTVSPLRLPGGTGCAVNPIAVF